MFEFIEDYKKNRDEKNRSQKSKAAAENNDSKKSGYLAPEYKLPMNEGNDVGDWKKAAKDTKLYAKTAKNGFDIGNAIPFGGNKEILIQVVNGGLDQIGQKSMIDKYQNVGKSAPNSSAGPKLFGRGMKGLGILTTGMSAYQTADSIAHDNPLAVKHGMDTVAGAAGLSGHPLLAAFSAGYTGMGLINSATDNAVPNFVYKHSGLQTMGKKEGDKEGLSWKANGQHARAKFSVNEGQERALKTIQHRIEVLQSKIDSTYAEILYLQMQHEDNPFDNFHLKSFKKVDTSQWNKGKGSILSSSDVNAMILSMHMEQEQEMESYIETLQFIKGQLGRIR